jgi:hypothetical protein
MEIDSTITTLPDLSKIQSRSKWKDLSQRRKFFDQYAESKNFDPLIAENWYPVSFRDLELAVCFKVVLTQLA